MSRLSHLKDATILLAPIASVRPEIFCLVVPTQSISASLGALEKVAGTFLAWNRNNESRQFDWKLRSLASVIELVTHVECSADLQAAQVALCSEMARKLGCQSVALGYYQNEKLKLETISGVSQMDSTSESYQLYQQALNETILREGKGTWPATDTSQDFLLLAHRQLCHRLQCEAVHSQAIRNSDGEIVGAWIFAGTQADLQNEKFTRFLNIASSRIGDSLELVRRAQPGWVVRRLSAMNRLMTGQTKLVTILTLLAMSIAMFIPMEYHVRTECEIVPQSRRFSVAPFAGLIENGFVEPGDIVKRGELLARMDGKMVRWELSSTHAELEKSLKQQKIDLTNRKIPESVLSQLENDRLVAKQKSLQYQNDNIELRSPIDGVVLSGSLERAEGASVQTGEVLFEVAPIDNLRIHVYVPADEIANVSPGMPASVWIRGQELNPVKGQVERIYPRSEMRDNKNVFVCEFSFENKGQLFRPGMKGSVRIDSHRQTLGWNLFHKPYGYLLSKLNW